MALFGSHHARAASMVSELSLAAARSDDPEGEFVPWGSGFGFSVRNRSNAMWRSDLRSNADDDGGFVAGLSSEITGENRAL